METHTKHSGISLAVWHCTGAGLTVGPTSQDNDGGPGASPREEVPAPRFGEVQPRRLRTAPCGPLPDDPAGPRGARASSGGASGSLPLPARGPGAVRGGSLGSWRPDPHPKDSSRGVHVDPGPRRDWSQSPARGGGGAATRFPFFSSSKPGEVIAQRGGPEEPRFPRLPPPPSLVGRGRGGTPCPPPLLPPWIWQPLALQGAGEALRPRPQLIGGSRRRPPSRTPQEYLLPSDSSPCCCSARPFGSQGGAQREPGPSRPHLAFGSMTPRLW
ncbi:translation initiation factor IF-2-like [Ailuropoda melanoleuca]|uniref:translation initiation factor IF-2-like n=1 Tax=Ailuropoda melanoleuca TaxID=9646 RepID=UPI001494F3B3|nr:translation initiation factor IF-2-like [Ailuropoda melanoleuca]